MASFKGLNPNKKGLLERLEDGVVVGDGGYIMALEKRGYVNAGQWTPEVTVENPDAVRQLHREFLRAGSDILQCFTFSSNDDKIKKFSKNMPKTINCGEINEQACKLAKQVAEDGNVLVAGSISENVAFLEGVSQQHIQNEVNKQLDVFMKHNIDFIICEYFLYIQEIEWVIEEARKCGLPIMATMRIGTQGDGSGISVGECAIRMARAKADVVGVNCMFDPIMTLDAIRLMKTALEEEGLQPYLATQPNGYFSTGTGLLGYLECPEFPFALETRLVNRFDVQKYAREAYDLGVRFIGGCCGFEAYHIRAIAEELSKERGGRLPLASEKHEPWGNGLRVTTTKHVRERIGKEYWGTLVPQHGRPKPRT